MSLTHYIQLLLLLFFFGVQTEPKHVVLDNPRASDSPSCWDNHGEHYHSRTVATTPLLSIHTKTTAWAEVSAQTTAEPDGVPGPQTEGHYPSCSNTSRVLMAGLSRSGQEVAFEQRPETGSQRFGLHLATDGNGLRIVDWSSDGRYLLFELWIWKYGAEGEAMVPILYDTIQHSFRSLDLYQMVPTALRKDCSFKPQLLGFMEAPTKVALAINPNNEKAAIGYACPNTTLWQIDFSSKTISPIHNYVPRFNGTSKKPADQ